MGREGYRSQRISAACGTQRALGNVKKPFGCHGDEGHSWLQEARGEKHSVTASDSVSKERIVFPYDGNVSASIPLLGRLGFLGPPRSSSRGEKEDP